LGLVDLPIMPLHLGREFGDTAFQLFGGRLQSDPGQGALIASNPNILISGQFFDFYYSKYVYLRPDECRDYHVFIFMLYSRSSHDVSQNSLSLLLSAPFRLNL